MEEIFSKAWEHFKQHWKFLCIVSAIGMLVPALLITFTMMSSIAASSAMDSSAAATVAASSIGVSGFIAIIVMVVATVGLMKASLLITNGGTPETRDLFLDFGTYLKGLAALILCIIAASIGFALCIVPGILIVFFTAFVPYEIIDNPNVGIIDAIKNSINTIKSDWKTSALIIILGGILVNVASYTGIGMIPAAPFLYLLYAVLYRQLKGQGSNATPQFNNPPTY